MGTLIFVCVLALYAFAAARMTRARFTRRGLLVFAAAGSALAFLRVGYVWFLAHRLRTHTWGGSLETLNALLRYVFPEEVLVTLAGPDSPFWRNVFFSLVLAAGSFFWASPLLLVGARRRARGPSARKREER